MPNRSSSYEPLVEYRALAFMSIIFMLNILDAVFTIMGVEFKTVVEINPIMNYLLSLGPWSFFFGKAAIGAFGSFVIYVGRYSKYALNANIMIIIVYLIILINHQYLAVS